MGEDDTRISVEEQMWLLLKSKKECSLGRYLIDIALTNKQPVINWSL